VDKVKEIYLQNRKMCTYNVANMMEISQNSERQSARVGLPSAKQRTELREHVPAFSREAWEKARKQERVKKVHNFFQR
jgi:hypothetical protein